MKVKETKKKQNIWSNRWLFIALVVFCSLAVIALVMNWVLPEEDLTAALQEDAWNRAAEQSFEMYDDGLIPVAPPEALPVNSEPLEEEPEPTEQIPQTETPSATGFILPVQGTLMKDFSAEELQYSSTMEDWRIHEGIDFAAAEGTEVVAVSDGTVASVYEDPMLGFCIKIHHTNGMDTLYANLQESVPLTEGTSVSQGTVVGKVGKTAGLEILEEPHLHFEVLEGETRRNPHDFFSDTVADDE